MKNPSKTKSEENNLYKIVKKTPLDPLPQLSKKFNNTLLLKREDLQEVFSFKIRGAYYKMAKLKKTKDIKKVIASSAGNHAQGVALAAKDLNINAHIVMPTTTPKIKVTAVKRLGAKVTLHGDTYDDAYDYAQKTAKKNNTTFIHPYDDTDVITGQGSVGQEILDQCPKADIIFVPVGGGGLLAGILNAIKEKNPKIKIVGVEPENAACLDVALKAKKRVTLKQVGIFADGVAVKIIGQKPFDIIKEKIDDMVLVSTDEICASIKDIYNDTRSISEPAGALSLAGLKKYVDTHGIKNKTLIAINSGANVNFDRLRHISERAEIGEESEALLAVEIPEKKGSFKTFCKELGKRSITEFNYRYRNSKSAHIFVGVALENGKADREKLVKTLQKKGFPVSDLSDNEMAKLHIRHMVGGDHKNIENEVLYRFRFPERPGALLNFLENMGKKWNITLFHYRNHGAAFGRALVGIQVVKSEIKQFENFIDSMGVFYTNESNNEAYRLFL